jgi:hypothetical protein
MKNPGSIICALALVGMHFNVRAANVLTVSGDNGDSGGGSSLAYLYGSDPYTSILAVGWTSSLTFSGVTISAQIASNNPVGATGRAFLTTQIGSGTTVSDQVATTSFVFPAFNGTWSDQDQLTLFTGLSLTAGVPYFLTIAPSAGETAGWNYGGTLTTDHPVLTGPTDFNFVYDNGYTSGPSPAAYLPASAFAGGIAPSLDFSVTGTVVPEPSSLAFVGIGLTLLSRRHRKRKN